MNEISPFEIADIPGVADLFMRVFRSSREPAPESLKAYIGELYFDNPWNDDRIRSFVNRAADGRISGFIGAMPRKMVYRDREITVVVAGNHMVDRESPVPFVGSNLLKRLLGGPQDLTITDSANETSRRLWERMSAAALLNYSLRWLRILRPATYPLSLVGRFSASPVLRALLSPAVAAGDRLGRLYFSAPDFAAADLLESRPVTPELIATGIQAMSGTALLRPCYDERGAGWLLAMAKRKEQYGKLNARALYSSGSLIGWYLYYARRGDTAHVLQLAARPDTIAGVMNHLFAGAFREGCAAVSGTVDPRLLREYHVQKCIMLLRDMYTMTHSANPDVLGPLLTGHAYFTRLDGEWWTRLQGDRFE